MKFPRSAGILLHPTSLPGAYGIGDLGPEAHRFADFLHDAGMKIWQMLPLNPTGYGDSPYQALSAFAGNPMLLSPDSLARDGWLPDPPKTMLTKFPDDEVLFADAIKLKYELLDRAAANFLSSSDSKAEFQAFEQENAWWLDDAALFLAAKEAHGERAWTEWDPALRRREPAAMEKWTQQLAPEITAQKFWQFQFYRQWTELKSHCSQFGIRIMGDIPIYVAHDSADVWANPDLFWLDEEGQPTKVAGVPPDYFSATGQLWGNPIYRWDRMQQDGFAWWIKRFRAALSMFDMVRVDHFRGFQAYWEIPAGEQTAINGQWVEAPGAEMFRAVTKALGPLPIVAENLGVITPQVEAIRHEFDYPGMAILQFAFSTDPQAPTFRPHNFDRHLVAYTCGHDNDTTLGWWHSGVADSTRSPADVEKERSDALAYFGVAEAEMDKQAGWVLIRNVMMSVADTAIFPMQDVLNLGSSARMNTPATLGRNWKWRMSPGVLKPGLAGKLREMALSYDR